MKKRRIRYSEFDAPAPSKQAAPPLAPAVAIPPAAPPAATSPPLEPRAKRNSTPVELARALAAAQMLAQAEQADETPTITLSEPFLRIRDRVRARSGIADLLMF